MTSRPITHVSDTARWVAIYRAMESERPDALFRDPYARRLAGAQGEAIVATLKRARRMAWPMIVRTALMDEIVMRLVTHDGVDAVLNLAAGLDARPWRLELPPALHWFDVDLPDVVTHKREQLAGETPRCRLQFVEADLQNAPARDALFDRVAAEARRVLVIAEGLLVYLEPEAVTALASSLARWPAFRWWLIDLGSPRVLRMMEKSWGRQMREGNAPFRFGPAEGTAFFEPAGWREAEFRSMWTESIRLRRTVPLARFWDLLGRLAGKRRREGMRRMSGVVLLERAAPN